MDIFSLVYRFSRRERAPRNNLIESMLPVYTRYRVTPICRESLDLGVLAFDESFLVFQKRFSSCNFTRVVIIES